MNVTEFSGSFHYAPRTYFKNALCLAENEQIPATLQSIDAAIVFSNNSPFYIYQKIKIFYKLGALRNCSQLIISQLEYLYKRASFYIVCRSIDYLQKINHYSIGQLQTILNENRIPYCIANHYDTWLIQRNYEFITFARKAMYQDDYPLCLCYSKLYDKVYGETGETLFMEAYAHFMLHNLENAKSSMLKYYTVSHDKTKAYTYLAFISMEMNNYDSAIKYLEDLLSYEPENITYLSYLGECYYLANRLPLAIQTYETIAKYEPDNLQNLFNLTHVCRQAKKNWQAKRCYNMLKKQLKQKN